MPTRSGSSAICESDRSVKILPCSVFTRSAGTVFSACLVVFCQAPVTLCFAENFRDPGSSLICFATPPPSPVSELKLLASAIPIPFSSSSLPLLSDLSLSYPSFNGALITEILFGYPGLGTLTYTAVVQSDYNLLMGTISIGIIAVATAALVVDLLYPLFDPRIEYR